MIGKCYVRSAAKGKLSKTLLTAFNSFCKVRKIRYHQKPQSKWKFVNQVYISVLISYQHQISRFHRKFFHSGNFAAYNKLSFPESRFPYYQRNSKFVYILQFFSRRQKLNLIISFPSTCWHSKKLQPLVNGISLSFHSTRMSVQMLFSDEAVFKNQANVIILISEETQQKNHFSFQLHLFLCF